MTVAAATSPEIQHVGRHYYATDRSRQNRLYDGGFVNAACRRESTCGYGGEYNLTGVVTALLLMALHFLLFHLLLHLHQCLMLFFMAILELIHCGGSLHAA